MFAVVKSTLLALLALAAYVQAMPSEAIVKRDCVEVCSGVFAACGTSNSCSKAYQLCLGSCNHQVCPRDLEGRIVC
ncbi:hypothetical protein FB45DRAFT_1046953 [Roridomyces roridus]|uniref:Extracellular membrane protein CFEM domain-containing protein n=1 Tax=Roridomyces roridus TaxID=1738132 RepID=A0AAD7F5J8_9AGAR|nr:hypothetical protein FB45DRAFT_1046953 [Roridomyces roridus]